MLEHEVDKNDDPFQQLLFSKIVPNCKKLGLLDAQRRLAAQAVRRDRRHPVRGLGRHRRGVRAARRGRRRTAPPPQRADPPSPGRSRRRRRMWDRVAMPCDRSPTPAAVVAAPLAVDPGALPCAHRGDGPRRRWSSWTRVHRGRARRRQGQAGRRPVGGPARRRAGRAASRSSASRTAPRRRSCGIDLWDEDSKPSGTVSGPPTAMTSFAVGATPEGFTDDHPVHGAAGDAVVRLAVIRQREGRRRRPVRAARPARRATSPAGAPTSRSGWSGFQTGAVCGDEPTARAHADPTASAATTTRADLALSSSWLPAPVDDALAAPLDLVGVEAPPCHSAATSDSTSHASPR